MSRRKNQKEGHQPVAMEHVLAPDARQRLARAFDLVLRAAARAEAAKTQQGTNTQRVNEEDLGHV